MLHLLSVYENFLLISTKGKNYEINYFTYHMANGIKYQFNLWSGRQFGRNNHKIKSLK